MCYCIICMTYFKADYSVFTKNIKTNHKASKFKVNGKVRITKYKNVFSKGYTKNWSREIFVIDSVLKTNPSTYKTKELNGEKNNRKFLWKKIVLE